MTIIPEATEALAALGEIGELSAKDHDFAVALGRAVDEGTPILQIDRFAADPTGDRIAHYKIADRVQALLAAARTRARNADAGEIKSRAG